jgi:hypothetical protein
MATLIVLLLRPRKVAIDLVMFKFSFSLKTLRNRTKP